MMQFGIDFEYKLRKRQLEAIPLIKDGKNFISVLPTGYGKTTSELMSIGNAIINGKTAISVVPMKSLSSEKKRTLEHYFPKKKIILDDGDHKVDKSEYDNWSIAVMTNERYDSFLRDPNKRKYLTNLGVIIFDEVHMVGDEGRGYRLESAIIKTKILFPNVQIVGSSATIDNAEEFANNFDFDLVKADKSERPVKLFTKIMVHRKGYRATEKAHIKAEVINNLLRKHVGKKVLVFVTSRARTSQIAKMIAGIEMNARISLKDLCDMHHIGYHHAGLKIEEKHSVEKDFLNGALDVVVCTPTLAFGVNLPADVVIVADMYQFTFLNGDEIIKKDRLEQTIGRAGRPQFSKEGYAYFLCNYEQKEEVKEHLMKDFDIHSTVKPRLKEVLLEMIVAGIIENTRDAFSMLDYFYDKTIQDLDIIDALTYLEDYKFIYPRAGRIFATHKGRMTAFHFIKPESVVYWEELLDKIGSDDMSLEFLFCLIASVPEYSSIVTVYGYDTLIIEHAMRCMEEEERRVLQNSFNAFGRLFIPNMYKIFGYTFKDEIINRFHLDKNFVRMSKSDQFIIQDSAKRYVSACKVILGKYPELFNKLIVASEKGVLNKDALDLVSLKGIGIKKLEKMLKNGINSLQKFLDEDNIILSKIVGMNVTKIKELKFDIVTSNMKKKV